MRTPTPPQVRRAVVRLYEEGRTYKQIAELLDLGIATVNRILRRHRETGSTEPSRPGGGNFSPIHGKVADKLKALIDAVPDATIRELTEAFAKAQALDTSPSSVARAVRRLGYTRKKSPSLR